VILIAAGANFYASLPSRQSRLKRYLGIRLVRFVNATLGYFPGDKLGFGGRQPRKMIDDWTFQGPKGQYRIIGDETDCDSALESLDLPVLFLSFSGDVLVPQSCAKFLAAKLRQADVLMIELGSKNDGVPGLHHYRWVRNPEPVLNA